GMYADKIRLVGTEKGVGVNLKNLVTTRDDIGLIVDGKVTLSKVQAKTDINVHSSAIDIDKAAVFETTAIQAGKDITFAADSLRNEGRVVAGNNMRLFVDRLDNGEYSLLQADQNLWLQKDAAGNLSASVNNNARLNTDQGDIVVRTQALTHNHQAGLTAGANAYINAASLNMKGLDFANVNPSVYDNNRISAAKNLILTGNTFETYRGRLAAGNSLVAEFNDKFNGSSMGIAAQQNVLINAGEIGVNYSTFTSPGQTKHAAYDVSFIADRDLSIHATDFLQAPNRLTLIAGNDLHISGTDKGLDWSSHHLDLLARKGSIHLYGPEMVSGRARTLKTADTLRMQAGQSIHLQDNVSLSANKDIELVAGKDISLIADRDNQAPIRQSTVDARGILRLWAEHNIKTQSVSLRGEHIELMSDKGRINLQSSSPNAGVTARGDVRLVADHDIGITDLPVHAKNIEFISRQGKISVWTPALQGIEDLISASETIRLFASKLISLAPRKPFNLAKSITLNTDYLRLVDKELNARDDLTLVSNSLSLWGSMLTGKNIDLTVREGELLFFEKDRPSVLRASENLRMSAGKNLVLSQMRAPHNTWIQTHNLSLSAGQDLEAPQSQVLKVTGDLHLFAGNDVKLVGADMEAGQQIRVGAGRDIDMHKHAQTSWLSPVDKEFARRYGAGGAKMVAGDHLQLRAGRDIVGRFTQLTSTGGDVSVHAGQDLAFLSYQYDADNANIVAGINAINAGKNLILSAAGALSAYATNLTAGRDMTISTGGNSRFESVQEHHKEGRTEHVLPRPSELNSGGALTISSQGSILFQATSLVAKEVMDIAAKGGILYAQAMEETYNWEEEEKQCNRVLGIKSCLFGSSTETRKKQSSTHKVAEFVAGGDINLMAKDDVTLEASRIETRNNAKITSQTGKVNFKAVPNSAFEQTLTHSTGFFITHHDQGRHEKTWVIPSVRVGGALTVEAAKGIDADVKMQEAQLFDAALTQLGNTPGTEWVKDLRQRGDVQWHTVKDAYTSWNKKSQGLSPVAGAIIAIAAAAVTAGSGLAGMAGQGAVATTGATGAAGSAIYGAAYSGMIALTSQAAVALVENQGNLTKTLASLAKRDSIKSLVTQMVVGGALAGLDHRMGWQKIVSDTGRATPLPTEVQLPILNDHDWGQVFKRVAAQSVVSSTIGTAINGGSFKDNLQTALLNNAGNQIHAEGAKLIGDNGEILYHPGKALSHAVLSGLSA
ncbi:DUF637 domain-containing protein, partial [Xenorhabdus bovienii]|uniref:DUF637 domain-containing protein n=1 Tax=Xenorhabdus bovienii TaxID=40576 RepID=UPI00237CD5FD